MLRPPKISAILILFTLLPKWAGAAPLDTPEVQAFITDMVSQHGFDAVLLRNTLSAAEFRPGILDLMARPGESKPWPSYLALFLKPEVVEAGVRFWNEHAAVLRRARRQFGVPEEIVVAILGVETRYGANAGRTPILDALFTLAFNYPRRADFFKSELEQFLLLGREEGLEVKSLRGSYAGAIGLPQFMPSSYRRYAIDFNGDGRRDLISSKEDVVGSVALYLKAHGWRADTPVAIRALGDELRMSEVIATGAKPQLTIKQFNAMGILGESTLADEEIAQLIMLSLPQGKEYWLALDNFRALLKYNQSTFYAMAVYQLSEALRRARYSNSH